MKFAFSLLMLLSILTLQVRAEGYGALGLGVTEYCDGTGGAFFLDSHECEPANFALRGLIGAPFEDYLRLEGSFDVHLDGLNFLGFSDAGNSREVAAILGVHGLVNLPVTEEFQLFAGPSLGGSVVHVKTDGRSYRDPVTNETEVYYEESSTDFSFNYGWTLGLEYETANRNLIRLQWQTWNGLQSKALFLDSFSSNSLFVFMGRAF